MRPLRLFFAGLGASLRSVRAAPSGRRRPLLLLGTGAAAFVVAFGAAWIAISPSVPPAQIEALRGLDASGPARAPDGFAAIAEGVQWRTLRLVEATTLESHETDAFSARVRVDETRATRVGAPVSGRVTQVHVELGQTVNEGDPLFSLASADIASLRAERDRAALGMELTETALKRVKAMVAAGAAPAKEELYATQDHRRAVLAHRLAHAKLASLRGREGRRDELTVRAPQSGVVIEKDVSPSQEVRPGRALVGIGDLSRVWVVADVLESDTTGIIVGSRARITSPSMPELDVMTEVKMVSPMVDPKRRTVTVRVELPNEDGRLRPNLLAEMRFQLPGADDAVVVEAAALRSDGARQYVYVAPPGGRFVRREVTAGSARGGLVPVLRGLSAHELVVVEGTALLDNQLGHESMAR